MASAVARHVPAPVGACARWRGALQPCQILRVDLADKEQSIELRAVAPLVHVANGALELVGPCTLVTNGSKVIAFSSAELLRLAPEPLEIALTLDGKRRVPIASWAPGRRSGLGVIELAQPLPAQAGDVAALSIAGVSATLDTRGAPAALVAISVDNGVFARRVIAVHVDAIGQGHDELARLASPDDPADVAAPIDGAPLFAWMPADPVLGRPSEVVALALAVPYPTKTFQPRQLPAIAQLGGLEDLASWLPWGGQTEGSNELAQVAGEIRDEDK